MAKVIGQAENHAKAIVALLCAAAKTHREDDARVVVTEFLLEALKQMANEPDAMEAFLHDAQQGDNYLADLLLKYEIDEVIGHAAIQNAVNAEFVMGGVDLSMSNTAQLPFNHTT